MLIFSNNNKKLQWRFNLGSMPKKYLPVGMGRLLLFLALLPIAGFSKEPGAVEGLPDSVKASPELVSFHKQFQPELIKLGNITYSAFSYDYANFSFIDAPEGVIVIDSGWHSGPLEQALKEFRKISDKPIKALIYTHSHTDHIGGSGFLVDSADGPVDIIGPKDWDNYRNYRINVRMPLISQRALAQLGMVLPSKYVVGSGIGRSPNIFGEFDVRPPVIEIEERQRRTIAGLELELIPAAGDLPEHMMILIPEERVLFAGDILGSSFPYIESARFEPSRSPKAMLKTFDLAISLKPEYVSPGHGRLLIGEADVNNTLTATRDVIQFFDNQVDRLIVKGIDADEAVDRIKVPDSLVNHPDLQPHYHRIEWIVRSMYVKRLGWNNSVDDLSKLSVSETHRRLVPMLGGVKAILKKAKKAHADSEDRWALALVAMALEVEPDNIKAHKLRRDIFIAIAEKTVSANERNYLLTAVQEYQSDFDWTDIIGSSLASAVINQSPEQLVRSMAVRIAPEKADGKLIGAELTVTDDNSLHNVLVRNNVLVYGQATDSPLRLSFDKDTLIKLYAGQLSWQKAREAGKVKCLENCGLFASFEGVFDLSIIK